jgi:hypothetical protein
MATQKHVSTNGTLYFLNTKAFADLHKETGSNSMVYFELTFGQRREKTLPKTFDLYVYKGMHDWLKHKPTMMPPYFKDLMNPNDHNYSPQWGLVHGSSERSGKSFIPKMSSSDSALHAYACVAIHDAATDSFDTCDEGP